MFSNITEAWNFDPVKEMTDKLSKGAFRANTDQSEIFNFKSQSNNINQTKVNNAKTNDIISLSDGNSLSLLSENTTGINTLDSDFGSFAPVNFDKYSNKKKQNKNKYSKRYDSISSDSDLSSTDSLEESRCNYSVKHLKKCDRCYDRLKKLVNTKVNRKFDEIILDTKMKQLQNVTAPQFPILQQPQSQPYIQNTPNSNSDSWKETLIIVIGAIIAIFIIFLIVKAMHK
ncbi:hypothetical protein QJ857_gp0654 [Tupanvirus soda lake]|uniref:Uncharacterized protein n=2 Tax=Tupanvirus TaxID=2094720 RepID=A0A6N1NLG7_9VIRU|nr:hypothetical protein QJ857_gp0654 [Tupanvirus soda lake]QKU35389.1 hypothetical protein [Tupanvirus soda lake]